ncbi:MAG: LCP family protein [Clostridia bacterium]|nr:LCP family protein [Clostridia bacterium]
MADSNDNNSFIDFPNSDSKKSSNKDVSNSEKALVEVKSNGKDLAGIKEDKSLVEKKKDSLTPVKKSVTEIASSDNETKSFSLPATDVKKEEADNTSKENPELEAKRKLKKRILKILLWVGVSILGLICGLIIFGVWYTNYLFSQIDFIEPEQVNQTIVNEVGETVVIKEITETTEIEYIEEETIHNYLLIGIDSRSRNYTEDGTGGLSDVNMILSVDTSKGTIKLVSIARDSYANIPGFNNPAKINSAMSRGGPELLKATVESNLRITLDGYAYVNFYNMAAVIDAVGGVYIDVTRSELYADHGLNDCLREVNALYGYDASYQQVNQTGTIWVNGRQAVAYSRIRYVGNGDYERSERQVEVLRSLLNQFMALSVTGKAAAIDDILSCISTNVSQEDITKYAFEFLPSLTNIELQYMQLPIQGCFNSGMYGDEWSIRPNWNAMIPYVQQFFYGESIDFDRVTDINHAPSDESCPTDIDLEELMR